MRYVEFLPAIFMSSPFYRFAFLRNTSQIACFRTSYTMLHPCIKVWEVMLGKYENLQNITPIHKWIEQCTPTVKAPHIYMTSAVPAEELLWFTLNLKKYLETVCFSFIFDHNFTINNIFSWYSTAKSRTKRGFQCVLLWSEAKPFTMLNGSKTVAV